MTSGSVLLDTGIVAALFRGDAEVSNRIAASAGVYVSSITIGELFYGAFRSMRREGELRNISEFSQAVGVLDCDPGTAEMYGKIKNGLRAKGRPIPENDIWIAATAMQHDMTLVMRDAHFEEVAELKYTSW